MSASFKRVHKLLEYLMDKNLTDWRVSIGCKSCGENLQMMAATAFTCWIQPHREHEVWMKNPFRKKEQ